MRLQSIALARRSHEVDHLVQTDLPMLEEWVRTSGNGYLAEQEPMGGDFQPYTSFGLVKSLWSGRGWAVFLSESPAKAKQRFTDRVRP